MNIQNTFNVPLAPAQAYDVLTDIERVAPCFPGAKLKQSLDADTHKGEVGFKLGPVQVNFSGKLQITQRDPAQHVAQFRANGKEQRGRGAATANITMRIEPFDQGSEVFVDTDLNLAGAVAQYGRGSGVVKALAEQILKQFADNLEQDIKGIRVDGTNDAISTSSIVGRAVVDSVKSRFKKED